MITAGWRSIPGYEGFYEASSEGEIRSLPREKTKGLVLSQRTHKNGRQHVSLSRDGLVKTHLVHRLVLAAFEGECPPGFEACHNDGDPGNNRIENLRYDTRSSNAKDAVQHRTHKETRKTHCPAGHEYDVVSREGLRRCRTCMREGQRARRERAKTDA